MQLPEGYAVNLFASEVEFPDLQNPVQFAFDAKGRLWVTTMPSYPMYLPGVPVNDKILILEDTNGDGVREKNGKKLQIRWLTYPTRQELPLLVAIKYLQFRLRLMKPWG